MPADRALPKVMQDVSMPEIKWLKQEELEKTMGVSTLGLRPSTYWQGIGIEQRTPRHPLGEIY